VLAAHCVHIDEGEMRTLMHAGRVLAHKPFFQPEAGLRLCPVQKMLEVGFETSGSGRMARLPTMTWICSRKSGWLHL